MSMRITTSMVQRNVLADLNSVSEKLTRSQMQAASGKEITKPSDDPFHASQAMAMRTSISGTQQHQRNVEDAMGWAEMTEDALDDITQNAASARDLLVQGSSDSTDQSGRNAIAAEMEQLIEAIKQGASQSYRGSYVLSGTRRRPARTPRAPTTRTTATRPATTRRSPGIVREIGPGVTMTINTVGRDVPRRRPGGRRRQVAQRSA